MNKILMPVPGVQKGTNGRSMGVASYKCSRPGHGFSVMRLSFPVSAQRLPGDSYACRGTKGPEDATKAF